MWAVLALPVIGIGLDLGRVGPTSIGKGLGVGGVVPTRDWQRS